MKRFMVAAVMASMLPLAAAQASHCANSDVFLFTRYTNTAGLNNPTNNAPLGNPSYHSGSLGCARDEETPEGTPDTSYVAPMSNSWSARWAGEGAATSARVVLKRGTTVLSDTTVPLTGAPPTSAWTMYQADGSTSLSSDASFTITVTINGVTRTYRTVRV